MPASTDACINPLLADACYVDMPADEAQTTPCQFIARRRISVAKGTSAQCSEAVGLRKR